MSKPSPQELADFETQCEAWFAENTVRDPGFMLPLTFMEVSTDQQFDFLRNWQRKVYEAGYFGMSWPAEYGGGGMHPEFQRIASRIMKSHDAPIMLNAIANGWTGPLLLDIGREEDKRRYIKPMLSAEEIWCQGFSEPEHGSDLGLGADQGCARRRRICHQWLENLDFARRPRRLYDPARAHIE